MADISPPLLVGYIFSTKKLNTSSISDFIKNAHHYGIDLIPIDLNLHPSTYPTLKVLLHKITDLQAKANSGSQESITQMNHFHEFIKMYPNMLVIDNPGNVFQMQSRQRIDDLLISALNDSSLKEDALFSIPKYHIAANLNELKCLAPKTPYLCKKLQACATSTAHQMLLVWNPLSLSNLENELQSLLEGRAMWNFNETLYVQEFIDHDGLLFKAYVLGDVVQIVARPSFNNLGIHRSPGYVLLDSQQISKNFDEFVEDHPNSLINLKPPLQSRIPELSMIKRIANVIRLTLNINLFGFDIILQSGTLHPYVVDVNYFPSYVGIPESTKELCKFIMKQTESHGNNLLIFCQHE